MGGMKEVCVCVYVYGIVNESVSNVLKIMSKNKLKKIIFENISDIGIVKEYNKPL